MFGGYIRVSWSPDLYRVGGRLWDRYPDRMRGTRPTSSQRGAFPAAPGACDSGIDVQDSLTRDGGNHFTQLRDVSHRYRRSDADRNRFDGEHSNIGASDMASAEAAGGIENDVQCR